MRTSAQLCLLVLGAFASSAVAESRTAAPPPELARPRVAVAAAPAEVSLTTGQLGLTAPERERERKEAYLTPRDITAEVSAYRPAIERCYLAGVRPSGHAGRLELMLIIGREGGVVSLDTAAPDLDPRAMIAVRGCILDAIGGLRFPERRNDTTAIVPYYFQRTAAPDAGPQPSCWNPRGCYTSG